MAKMNWTRVQNEDRIARYGADPIASDRARYSGGKARQGTTRSRECIGLTKKGLPCMAGPEHGFDTCPSHRKQEKQPVSMGYTNTPQERIAELEKRVAQLEKRLNEM